MIDNEALHSLERLHKLKEDGVITAEEFEASKQRLLSEPAKAVRRQTVKEPIGRPAEDDHVGWALLALKRYAQFDGRSSRREFWMFQLLIVAAVIVLSLIASMGTWTAIPAALVGALGLMGIVIPCIAVQVRRFHDQGKSGWFVLFNLIPYLGSIVALIFMALPGTEGDNEFGPDPRL